MLLKFGEIQNFNTGNWYSAEGQPITWATFEFRDQVGIVYQDHARGILTCIPLPGHYGHTRYQGNIKPWMYDRTLCDAYVRECERNSVGHGSGNWDQARYDAISHVEREFTKLIKGTKRVILEQR